MNKKALWEGIRYLIFGVLSTIVNFVVHFGVLAILRSLNIFPNKDYLIATVVAWIFAVAFAYVTNKLWVFESKSWAWPVMRRELPAFLSARIFSLAVEAAGLWLMVEVLLFESWTIPIPFFPINGGVVAKVLMQGVVIVLNYIFSKLVIFKKKSA